MKIKPIENHEGYWISDQGDVFTQWVNKGIHGLTREVMLKKLKCSRMTSGYLTIRIGGRKGKWKLVHRLVYESFKGKIPEGMYVRHLNDDPSDNRFDNLEIGTQKDNMGDSIRLGNFPIGVKNGQSKLNEEQILFIRANAGKVSHEEMAQKLGVNRSTVSHVARGDTWKSIKN